MDRIIQTLQQEIQSMKLADKAMDQVERKIELLKEKLKNVEVDKEQAEKDYASQLNN